MLRKKAPTAPRPTGFLFVIHIVAELFLWPLYSNQLARYNVHSQKPSHMVPTWEVLGVLLVPACCHTATARQAEDAFAAVRHT